jgi:hypothetical protein
MALRKLRLLKRLSLVEERLTECERILARAHPKQTLELKMSRRAHRWSAPYCAARRQMPNGTWTRACSHHTLHASGYCKIHRDASISANGLVVESPVKS